ncbi:MAG: hypothetical protein ACI8QD_001724 [Cyclobacteriaceae bacterium]|jgi:hypothetical protein
MSQPNDIRILRLVSICLIFLSLTLAVTDLTASSVRDLAEETTATEDGEAAKNNTFISEAIQSTFQLNLSFQCFLIQTCTVQIAKNWPDDYISGFFMSDSKGFKILLRRIISMNAP